jgi:LmbE family N-acetylglucosaminyl deacetylase
MKYLFICAHPDDLEFSCANLIQYLTFRGKNIEILCLTKGEFGIFDDKWVGPRLARIRVRELEKAAQINGVSRDHIHYANFVDGFVKFTKENVLTIKEWLHRLQPDIIFASEPYFAYYWQTDHINCGKLAYYTFASYFSEFTPRIRSFYFYNTIYPNFLWPFNDLTQGKSSLRAHKSQWWFLKWVMPLYSLEKFNLYKSITGKWKYIEKYRRLSSKKKRSVTNIFLRGILGLISHLPPFNPTAARYHVDQNNSHFAQKVRKLREIHYPES